MATTLEQIESPTLLVHMRPVFEMDDDMFAEFCRINRDLRIEMTAEGNLIIMSPTGGRTGNRNAKLTQQVANWADTNDTGVSFDSSTLFKLPDGAKRSPDVSWVRRENFNSLPMSRRINFCRYARIS
jgi:Uma2 family endonuclease